MEVERADLLTKHRNTGEKMAHRERHDEAKSAGLIGRQSREREVRRKKGERTRKSQSISEGY